ncbi:hypothetical protein CDEST_01256 [Colletotrichum destructivum]|uniref:Uncharacterized protein n=1 Tax=Colletotrichum destructivum TaxID=34406 RepID=A0AAX4HYJ6_9PEZI|nr:hypothetical protein CDEST_01256 [Colletotrichum destructivum]
MRDDCCQFLSGVGHGVVDRHLHFLLGIRDLLCECVADGLDLSPRRFRAEGLRKALVGSLQRVFQTESLDMRHHGRHCLVCPLLPCGKGLHQVFGHFFDRLARRRGIGFPSRDLLLALVNLDRGLAEVVDDGLQVCQFLFENSRAAGIAAQPRNHLGGILQKPAHAFRSILFRFHCRCSLLRSWLRWW